MTLNDLRMARKLRRLALGAIIALGLASATRPAAAQLGSMSGSSSRSTMGGSSSGGMGGLASQPRNSNSNGLNNNMTAADFNNTFGNNLLLNSFGGGAMGGNRGMMGGMGGMGGMLGGRMGMGGMGMGGMGFGGMNQMGNRNGMMNGMQQNPRANLRIPLRLSFTPPTEMISQRAAQFQTRVNRLPAVEAIGNVAVEMDGTKAILRGDVPSTEDRDLVERLALMEPGIDSVENNLEVVLTDAAATTPATTGSSSNRRGPASDSSNRRSSRP